MSDPLLRPGEVKKLKEGLAACSRCEDRVRGMRAMGVDPGEDESRAAALRQLISGALDVSELWLKQQTVEDVQ